MALVCCGSDLSLNVVRHHVAWPCTAQWEFTSDLAFCEVYSDSNSSFDGPFRPLNSTVRVPVANGALFVDGLCRIAVFRCVLDIQDCGFSVILLWPRLSMLPRVCLESRSTELCLHRVALVDGSYPVRIVSGFSSSSMNLVAPYVEWEWWHISGCSIRSHREHPFLCHRLLRVRCCDSGCMFTVMTLCRRAHPIWN